MDSGERQPHHMVDIDEEKSSALLSYGNISKTVKLGGSLKFLSSTLPVKESECGDTALEKLHRAYELVSTRFPEEKLSGFLKHLPGYIDEPGKIDGSTLRSLISQPPAISREIQLLTPQQLSVFNFLPGTVPEQYRLLSRLPPDCSADNSTIGGVHDDVNNEQVDSSGGQGILPFNHPISRETESGTFTDPPEKKHKKDKTKKGDRDEKKRRREKRRKDKRKHSPESSPS